MNIALCSSKAAEIVADKLRMKCLVGQAQVVAIFVDPALSRTFSGKSVDEKTGLLGVVQAFEASK
jgi:hypothetical protein